MNSDIMQEIDACVQDQEQLLGRLKELQRKCAASGMYEQDSHRADMGSGSSIEEKKYRRLNMRVDSDNRKYSGDQNITAGLFK